MNLVGPIITSILLLYVRIRIINTIFSQKKIKIGITIKIFGLAIAMVGSIFAYTYILGFFGRENLGITNTITTKSLGIFILYCTIFVILITLIFKNRYKSIGQTIFIGSLFFIGLAYGGYITGINVLLLYYLVSAYAEEYMKYTTGNNMFLNDKEDPNPSNLIFFCILTGLGFSAIENIVYILSNIINNQNIDITNLVIGRGLVSTLIHIVSTSIIAYIVIKTKKSNNIYIPVILGIIGGFGLHSAYNISLQYNLSFITIPIVILAFFLMTYLTFQSDIIYRTPKK